jgi:NAD(P)-dependent dehydrogenase (short-subunit alcohol dehydrogenase family)
MLTEQESMKDRVCLITGATSGIGKATAVALARMGATVVIHGRNPQKCEATADAIRQRADNPHIETLVADLASLQDTRRLAQEFTARHKQLHLLVNNAGLSLRHRLESRDGFELMFAVNHLAHFLLTNLLLDTIVASAPARIISVSSGLHKYSKLDFADLQMTHKFSAMRGYGVSKLANIMFTYELARRLAGRGVTVNTMNPGMTATNIGMEEGGIFSASKKLMDRIMGHSAEQGADTVVFLAASPEVAGVSGKYFEKRKAVASSATTYDDDACRKLWEISAELVGLKQAEAGKFNTQA